MQAVLGIPIRYDPNTHHMAYASGFWPFKKIVVGAKWCALPAAQRMAVLMHEAKHCRAFHLEVRALLAPLFWTRFVVRIVHAQEFAADAFAVEMGYGLELARAMSVHKPNEWHPSYRARVERIVALIERKNHALAL